MSRSERRHADLAHHPQRRGHAPDPLPPVRRPGPQPRHVGQHHHPERPERAGLEGHRAQSARSRTPSSPFRPVVPAGAMGGPELHPQAQPGGRRPGRRRCSTTSTRHGNPTNPITNQLVNFGWEYVWHCHILSHEEMDMMRPADAGAAAGQASGLGFSVVDRARQAHLRRQLHHRDVVPGPAELQRRPRGPNAGNDRRRRSTCRTSTSTRTFTDPRVYNANLVYEYRVVGAKHGRLRRRVPADDGAVRCPRRSPTGAPPAAPTGAARRRSPPGRRSELTFTDNATDETGFCRCSARATPAPPGPTSRRSAEHRGRPRPCTGDRGLHRHHRGRRAILRATRCAPSRVRPRPAWIEHGDGHHPGDPGRSEWPDRRAADGSAGAACTGRTTSTARTASSSSGRCTAPRRTPSSRQPAANATSWIGHARSLASIDLRLPRRRDQRDRRPVSLVERRHAGRARLATTSYVDLHTFVGSSYSYQARGDQPRRRPLAGPVTVDVVTPSAPSNLGRPPPAAAAPDAVSSRGRAAPPTTTGFTVQGRSTQLHDGAADVHRAQSRRTRPPRRTAAPTTTASRPSNMVGASAWSSRRQRQRPSR